MAKPTIDELFDRPATYPDVEARERLAGLVGLDEHKVRLAKILGLLVNPASLDSWMRRYHPRANGLLDSVLRRPPLVVLAGDVGSGKSELAETIGDYVARREKVDITLYPMSLAARGRGRVGQMTENCCRLPSTSFWRRLKNSRAQTGSREGPSSSWWMRQTPSLSRAKPPRCTTRIGPG